MTRLKRLFTAWQGSRKERGLAPPPDPGQPVRTDSGRDKLVEVVASGDGRHRVGITRSAGVFRLYAETWAPDWDTLGTATWLSHEHLSGFADSLENARESARETLHRMSGEPASEE